MTLAPGKSPPCSSQNSTKCRKMTKKFRYGGYVLPVLLLCEEPTCDTSLFARFGLQSKALTVVFTIFGPKNLRRAVTNSGPSKSLGLKKIVFSNINHILYTAGKASRDCLHRAILHNRQ